MNVKATIANSIILMYSDNNEKEVVVTLDDIINNLGLRFLFI